jgi:16S rRNA (guanine527-N7)-methyltransferase
MDKNIQKTTFNRFTRVSRETITSLEKYENNLINANIKLNLIGKSTIKDMWKRHFLDSAQVIDFIDKNSKTLVDIGSGAGFPGLILSIIIKDRKMPIKVQLIEKSPKKAHFLNKISGDLNLNVEVSCCNIFDTKKKISKEVIVARAFKPLGIILDLIHKKTQDWKKIFIFLGKTGKNELIQASKIWDIEYKQRVSITSNDSAIIEINNLKKK